MNENQLKKMGENQWNKAGRFLSCVIEDEHGNQCHSNSVAYVRLRVEEGEDPDDGEVLFMCDKHFKMALASQNPPQPTPTIRGPLVEELPDESGNPVGRPIMWRPLHLGLNVLATSLEPQQVVPVPLGDWVLASRSQGDQWEHRTEPVPPPAPGLMPIRLAGGWFWNYPAVTKS